MKVHIEDNNGFSISDWRVFYNCLYDLIKLFEDERNKISLKIWDKDYDSLSFQEKEKIVTLLDCDLDATNLENISVSENGDLQVLLSTQNEGVDRTYGLYTLHPVDAAMLPEKTVLTLATLDLSQSLRQQIAKFNRENDTYRIEVLDYSQYSEVIASPGSYTKDSSPAITKLNTELLSGNLPDLIDVSGGELPVAQYAVKGFLEDLLPYLNADSAVSPDKLMESVLNAVKTDGKLYQLPTSFQVVSAAGKREIVGGYESWTTDEVEDALKKLPEGATVFNVDYTKSHVLYLCASGAMNRFVDWQAGTCSFDTDEFVAFALQSINNVKDSGDTVPYTMVLTDKDGKIVDAEFSSITWNGAWTRNIFAGFFPRMPQTAGDYTLTIYFNNQFTAEKAFTVNAAQ